MLTQHDFLNGTGLSKVLLPKARLLTAQSLLASLLENGVPTVWEWVCMQDHMVSTVFLVSGPHNHLNPLG